MSTQKVEIAPREARRRRVEAAREAACDLRTLANHFNNFCEPTERTSIPNDDRVLSFSIDTLRAAGASLGAIRSAIRPPRTTFDDLARRAEALLAQAIERERRGL
jgi:hypothetical protein